MMCREKEMEAEKLWKKLKKAKPIGLKKKKKEMKKSMEQRNENQNPKFIENESPYEVKQEKYKSTGKKRRNGENMDNFDTSKFDQVKIEVDKSNEADKEKKKSKLLRNKKRKNDKIIEAEFGEVDYEMEERLDKQNSENEAGEKKRSKSRKKKRKGEKIKKEEIERVDKLYSKVEDCSNQQNGKSRKAHKAEKRDHLFTKKDEKLLEKRGEAEEDGVYDISSGDEDCSRGMKKWIMEYHHSRPGLKILQQRIDDFIASHEAQEEQARKEREALAAEGGWTVVVHHKGRKKTTDSESGIVVGSVAQAAVLDNMAKKKSKEIGLDFYRFQKREAQRNEIMMLQSKFEQDKKRIQQLRAARKFRPY